LSASHQKYNYFPIDQLSADNMADFRKSRDSLPNRP
jgi:hypothetical protein